jgi:hypothetical protein
MNSTHSSTETFREAVLKTAAKLCLRSPIGAAMPATQNDLVWKPRKMIHDEPPAAPNEAPRAFCRPFSSLSVTPSIDPTSRPSFLRSGVT